MAVLLLETITIDDDDQTTTCFADVDLNRIVHVVESKDKTTISKKSVSASSTVTSSEYSASSDFIFRDIFSDVENLIGTAASDEAASHHYVVSNQNNKREQEFRLVCIQRCSEEFDQENDDEEDDDNFLQPWSMDDFEIVQRLGSGASGTVFRARERQSNYEVAIKVQRANEDALCEMDVHIDLEHPAIVKMIDYFYTSDVDAFNCGDDNWGDQDDEHSEFLVFILELCQESLFDTIQNRPERYIPEYQAASMFHDILDALQTVHSQGIIHCDVKSLNLLVTHDTAINGGSSTPQLKLADFGMAVRKEDREVVGGSYTYMAPEHLMAWRKSSDEFDHRSDIYSLGVVLYETLTGYMPYQLVENDQDYEELWANGRENEPILDLRQLDDWTVEETIYIPPPVFPDHVSEEAQNLIERMMRTRPDDRITLEQAREHPWFVLRQQG
ncbi:serine/threonine protein kinase [Nitzschia inconspicua]|uniref:Serine/threonine protein kinase n=1 Tax=Nitzschia inconspicua TaxID=303405 RepID=A0A9K3KSR3_9STRA|nr:serine/threonine protein kinase [Nitzschia inconspicua]